MHQKTSFLRFTPCIAAMLIILAVPCVQHCVACFVENSFIRQSLNLVVFDQQYRCFQDESPGSAYGQTDRGWRLIWLYRQVFAET